MSLRRTLPLALALGSLAGCPEVDQDGPPASVAVATFDPNTATIPLPNDLALRAAPPAGAGGLQGELLRSFIAAGGFPADQEVAITIPIAVKTRQPDGSYGNPTAPAALDLATVNDSTVALLRLDTDPVQRLQRCTATPAAAPCFEPTYANGALTLRRNAPDGSRRWDAGGRYVVAVRGGGAGVKTADGLALGADTPIALIAPNRDLSSAEFQPPGGLSAAQVATLEGLRSFYAQPRAWVPLNDAAACAPVTAPAPPAVPCWAPAPGQGASAFDAVATVFPTAELASLQTFTAQPAAAVRPLTDTGSGQIPLPSDFLLDPATGGQRVRNVASFGPAAAGLATLDGFSTTAPLLIPLTGPVQAATIDRNSARIYDLTGGVPVQLTDLSQLPTPPQIVTQPPTAVSNGLSTSVVLAPAVPVELTQPAPLNVYVPPLKEKTQYLVVVTNDVLDAQGNKLQRSTLMDLVFSFQGPLFDPASNRSLVPGVAASDAAALAQLRTSLGPVLDALNLRSCASGARCAVLAYTVRTQSVKDVSKLLAAAPYGVEQAAGGAVFVPSGVAPFSTEAELGIPAAAIPNARLFQATIPTVYAIQGATGAFDPAFATWTPAQVQQNLRPIPVLIAAPLAGGGPAPLVVFQHGINGSRLQMVAAAAELTGRGFVVAAIDLPYHGDRALCAQNSDCAIAGGGDGVCTPDPALQTPSDPTPPGTCTTGTLRRDASLSTQASGNFFLSSNFFRIRDGLRQAQLDQSALVLALARPPSPFPQPGANPLADAGVLVNPTQVYYAGISLGAMVGTSTVATNPRFARAALNVPGGTLVDVVTTAPAFQPRIGPIFAGLGIDVACVQQGTGCDAATRAAQTARFAQTLAIAKWILDPAEPLNYAANLTTKTFDPALQPFVAGGLGSATTAGYGQMVLGDPVVPNPTNRLLLNLALPGAFTTYDAALTPVAERHGLLLANFTSAQTARGAAVRQDLADFLQTAALPPATRTLP
jgi:hypothetical protein